MLTDGIQDREAAGDQKRQMAWSRAPSHFLPTENGYRNVASDGTRSTECRSGDAPGVLARVHLVIGAVLETLVRRTSSDVNYLMPCTHVSSGAQFIIKKRSSTPFIPKLLTFFFD